MKEEQLDRQEKSSPDALEGTLSEEYENPDGRSLAEKGGTIEESDRQKKLKGLWRHWPEIRVGLRQLAWLIQQVEELDRPLLDRSRQMTRVENKLTKELDGMEEMAVRDSLCCAVGEKVRRLARWYSELAEADPVPGGQMVETLPFWVVERLIPEDFMPSWSLKVEARIREEESTHCTLLGGARCWLLPAP